MDGIYSANTSHMTVDLPLHNPAIRPHIWLAVGLTSFVVFYAALSTWLSWFALHLLFGLNPEQTSLFTLVAGASSGFMAVFMVRTLVRFPLYIFRNYLNAR